MTRRLSRRAFITSAAALATGSAIAVVPRDSHAQQPASPRRIGFLSFIFSPESKEARAFRQALYEAGYVEGRDVVIEWRTGRGDYGRLPQVVADLVKSKVDVIVVDGTVTTLAAKRETSTVPIVMALAADPVGSGLVANLAHPGGNITGLSTMLVELSGKRLQLLKEMIPRLNRVAVLWNPDVPFSAKVIEELRTVAPAMAIELNFVGAQTPEEIGPAFSAVSRARAQALYVIPDPFFLDHRTTLFQLALKARLPAIYPQRAYTDDGGLMSYGPNFEEMFRRSVWYVDKILKGAKPGDLPIEQPTQFELVVNLRTAKALGLTIPESVLLRADELIR